MGHPPVRLVVFHFLVSTCIANTGFSDLNGPSLAQHALSPDGKVIVRVERLSGDNGSPPQYEASYYQFHAAENSYRRTCSFVIRNYSAQLLFVSNAGDLLTVMLSERDAITLYSPEGNVVKSWNLSDFLSNSQIAACAETGSTVQWFDEGAFHDREFSCIGPSRRVRAVQPPFTIMRGVNGEVSFTISIDVVTRAITNE